MPRAASPVEAIAYSIIELFAQRTRARAPGVRGAGAGGRRETRAPLRGARHYHNLLDGLALLREARRPHRPVHILVTLDWTRTPLQRRGMELACRMARWPAVLRTDAFTAAQGYYEGVSAYRLSEAQPMLRAATRLAIDLLRAGETLVIFPEAYPNVDPFPTPKADGRAFLPFEPGFAKLAQLAERDGATQVNIVPAGFAYENVEAGSRPRWRITLRYGEPLRIAPRATPAEVAALVAQVERAVHTRSAPADLTPARP